MTAFHLQCAPEEIRPLAGRYEYGAGDDLPDQIAETVRPRGYFTKDEFVQLCEWKSPRTRSHAQSNSALYVEEVTRIALSTPVERLRVEILTLLDGVSWPTASVILHFTHSDPYPILDYRALWTLGVEKPPTYGFDLWWAYTQYCRELAREVGVSMRGLDRALWQYSKENQGVELED